MLFAFALIKKKIIALSFSFFSCKEAEENVLRHVKRYMRRKQKTYEVRRCDSNSYTKWLGSKLYELVHKGRVCSLEKYIDTSSLTHFELAVYKELTKIKRGEVRSYKDIARELGSNARPVASALSRNPFPLIFPCHRIIMSNGRLGGYFSKKQNKNKEIILALEKAL